MAKFKVTVTCINEYEIDIDEEVWTPEALREWSRYFSTVENTAALADHLGEMLARNGITDEIEGFGYLDGDTQLSGRNCCEGITVNAEYLDEYEVEIEPIE